MGGDFGDFRGREGIVKAVTLPSYPVGFLRSRILVLRWFFKFRIKFRYIVFVDASIVFLLIFNCCINGIKWVLKDSVSE